MLRNPILAELYEIRRQLLANCNDDLSAYAKDAQRRLEASGRPIADIQQRRIRRTESGEPVAEAKSNASGVS